MSGLALVTPAAVAHEPTAARGDGDRLRIVHVLRAPVGGLFRHVLDLTRAQSERGHLVGLVTDSRTGGPGAESVLARLQPSLGLGLLRIPMQRNPTPSDLVNFNRIGLHLRRVKPDVVHGHGAKGGFYARAIGFLPGAAPAVRAYTPHGGSFTQDPGSAKHRLFMAVERLLTRRTDVLLFESAFIAKRFEAFVGTTNALQRVIPNGIAPEEFVPVMPQPGAADFLYVGELRTLKGIDILLSALAEVGRRMSTRPRLVMVGSGPDAESLRRHAGSLGLSEQIEMPGPMPARTAFALGRTLVVPSRSESLPYIVLEAAGAQMPLISTDVGGIPEIFGPYRDRLIPCDDVAILANAMQAMLTSSDHARARAAEGLAGYVRARFSFDNMASAVIDGYRDAMAVRRRSGRPLVNSSVTPVN